MLKTSKIKIISQWSLPGGSTLAHINLCNLLSSHGYNCTFYGPHSWHLSHCQGLLLNEFKEEAGDLLVLHFFQLAFRPSYAKKVILSCHEKELFPIQQIQSPFWDHIHFVSHSQQVWHNVDYPQTVIPVPLEALTIPPKQSPHTIAGIIGSVDPNKQTHLSIQRALDKGYRTVFLYGAITDQVYYQSYVAPLIDGDRVNYQGYCSNKQDMYQSIDCVFSSSKSECYNTVYQECRHYGIPYDGLKSGMVDAEIWPADKILSAWIELLEL